MVPFEEMKARIGFEPTDEARLTALWPRLEPQLDAILQRLSAPVPEVPALHAPSGGDAAAGSSTQDSRAWLKGMILGPWNDTWVERRQREGRARTDARQALRNLFITLRALQDSLVALALDEPAQPEAIPAILKVTNLDFMIAAGTYADPPEVAERSTLQNLIVMHMPVTVLLLGADGVVCAATRPERGGLIGGRSVTGQHWREVIPPELDEVARLEEQMASALQGGQEVALPRVDATLDGQKRTFRISIVPLDHAHAQILLHVEELTDALETERHASHARSLSQLGALSEAVANELRNPLAGISGALTVIASSLAEDDRRKGVMEEVGEQVRRLDDLVRDLLDFALPVKASMEQVNLGAVVEQIVAQVRRGHAGVRIAADGVGMAWADRHLLQQILQNLLSNAVEAAGERGEIRVHVAPGEVLVSDSGPGIPSDQTEEIFSPFFTTRARGTGLGLAICRKAADAMGGRVFLSTGPLCGAAFRVELGF